MRTILKIHVILFVLCLFGCKQEPVLPVLTTNSVASVSYNTAVARGTITDEGGDPVSHMGICWSTGTAPTIADNKTILPGAPGSFTCNLSGLSLNTTYFARAFATNSAGTGYGNAVSFKTLKAGAAVISTISASSVTSHAAISGGIITDESGANVTEEAFVGGHKAIQRQRTTKLPMAADREASPST